jgi:hypothetical protein
LEDKTGSEDITKTFGNRKYKKLDNTEETGRNM